METLADRIRARLKFVEHPVDYRLLLEAEAALRNGEMAENPEAVLRFLASRDVKLLKWQHDRVLGG